MPTPSEHSAGSEPVDLGTTPLSLARTVLARRAEYVGPRRVRVKIGTWNVAACPGTDKDLAAWFVAGRGLDRSLATLDPRNPAVRSVAADADADADDADADSVRVVGDSDIGLYVVGLQEVVDLSLTRDYMSSTVYGDSSPIDRWRAALEDALPPGYELVVAEQMTGLLLLVYASPDLAPTITNVSTRHVGTGVLGYFGNKGAVITRLVLGETTRIVLVNCHLASGAGASHLDRRCWDVGQILSKTRFDPVVHAGVAEDDGDRIGHEDFAFWFGDLNFRLDGLPGDDIRRLLTLHSRGEYGRDDGEPRPPDGPGLVVGCAASDDGRRCFDSPLPDPDDFVDPAQDPTSLQSTLDSLLPHDQLRRVIARRRAFHDGWREGPITFLPSYKYDVGTVGLFDSSEKQRAPSWCDRILYRTRADKLVHDRQVEEERAARQRDEEMRLRGLDDVDDDDDVLFSYNPEADGGESDDGDDGANAETDDDGAAAAEAPERVSQDIYTSHQRITSSDHKPIVSVFTLDYDAAVPELKAKIHAEVARELDRAENEGRPSVTVVAGDGDGVLDLGDVAFLARPSAVATIANTGRVPASLAFVERLGADDGGGVPAAPWLTTAFLGTDDDGDDSSTGRLGRTVSLEPGETVLARVEAHVSAMAHVRALNDGRARLEDVLVLRVAEGRDHFVPVRGAWLPTCFGRSIDELIRVPDGGIRSLGRDPGPIPHSAAVRCSAPKELFRLTEALQALAERCAADAAMLDAARLPRDPGWPLDASTWSAHPMARDAVKAAVAAALDTDAPLAEALPAELPAAGRLELLSEMLLLFLASLTDGLVPPPVWAKLLSSSCLSGLATPPSASWDEARDQVLDVLSTAPNHSVAFVVVASALARLAAELAAATGPDGARPSGLGRRLSLRRGGDGGGSRWRHARQRRYAEIVGPLAGRAPDYARSKEKERFVMEVFLRDAGG